MLQKVTSRYDEAFYDGNRVHYLKTLPVEIA
jgi:hypothetical protein